MAAATESLTVAIGMTLRATRWLTNESWIRRSEVSLRPMIMRSPESTREAARIGAGLVITRRAALKFSLPSGGRLLPNRGRREQPDTVCAFFSSRRVGIFGWQN